MNFIFGHLLEAVGLVAYYLLEFYMWIVIGRAILSWVDPDPNNPIVRFIYNVTEPLLYRIRSKLPITMGGIDFSPIILILGIILIQRIVVMRLIMVSKEMLFG